MESTKFKGLEKQDSPVELPSLIRYITSGAVAGFDNAEESSGHNYSCQTSGSHISSPLTKVADTAAFQGQNFASPSMDLHQKHSFNLSMASSPLITNLESTDNGQNIIGNGIPRSSTTSEAASTRKKKEANYSQPISAGPAYVEAVSNGRLPNPPNQQPKNPSIDNLKDKRFDSFKTWSGRFERQISQFRGKQKEPEPDVTVPQAVEVEALPVNRYFDALEGPELEKLRASEELVLPEDEKWPFLLRYPVSSFGICLGTSSQAILWKTLATSSSTNFLHVSLTVNLVLWSISVALLATVFFIYSLKIIFYFEAVRREYYHPIRINFFFAPWISFLFLALGVPPCLTEDLHAALWYLLMTPIFCLELKIYGQWMSGGQRKLSRVANPSNHLSVVGNFVGALLGASMGLKEGPIFFFAIGLAHYTVLFVTLYQRLPTNETLPKELHPVFFLFVAAPSVASMAWARIQGSFDHGSRIAYFIALFLYLSLAVRINFFRGFRFSLAWWAYTFPMTGASIATVRYANEITNPVTQTLSVILSAVSTLIVTALLISTILHAFVFRDLFPNDIAIAIANSRLTSTRKRFHTRSGSSESIRSDTEDIEACCPINMNGVYTGPRYVI